eukprot:scaffold253883_cov59-Attheya_sp.AAC.2
MSYPYRTGIIVRKKMKVFLPLFFLGMSVLVTVSFVLQSQKVKPAELISPWHPKSNAQICPNDEGDNLKDEWFKSQSAEDKLLLQWFKTFCNGSYIEMGGLDGVVYSNSHVFHHGLGWKGVLIEASPIMFKQLEINRPNELAIVNEGVCHEEKNLHWIEKNGAVSGILEFASASFRESWWSDEDVKNAREIVCKPLKKILDETVGKNFFFDFLSLDIEGGEFMALQSLDFDTVSFGIVLVEAGESYNDMPNMATRTLLEANGYTFLHNMARSNWFVNKDFASIYKDLI